MIVMRFDNDKHNFEEAFEVFEKVHDALSDSFLEKEKILFALPDDYSINRMDIDELKEIRRYIDKVIAIYEEQEKLH